MFCLKMPGFVLTNMKLYQYLVQNIHFSHHKYGRNSPDVSVKISAFDGAKTATKCPQRLLKCPDLS